MKMHARLSRSMLNVNSNKLSNVRPTSKITNVAVVAMVVAAVVVVVAVIVMVDVIITVALLRSLSSTCWIQ
jgi:hypothetical protein